MKRIILLLLILIPFPLAFASSNQPLPSGDASLHYEAFLAGASVGEAKVNVAMVDGSYQVEGTAWSSGLMQRLGNWRTRFVARGDVSEAASAQFSYSERNSGNSRIVHVGNGVLRVTKNGRQRPPLPSPPGPDLLSALFVPPHCGADHVVHTGRHVYRLTRLARDAGSCRYRVVDDDDDTFELELLLQQLGELVVPKRITVYGRLTGHMVLVGSDGLALH